MKFLTYTDPLDAAARSAEEASRRGCRLESTLYWWTIKQHPVNGTAALEIPDGDVAGLSIEEQAAVVDALDASWTPQEVTP